MMQTELLTKRISAVGEEIPQELGAKMIQDYQKANPIDVRSYIIGKEILNRILAQPGCTGVRFFNAFNEIGEKTLVYVGLDAKGQDIISYSGIDKHGVLTMEKGIVGDRAGRDPMPASPQGGDWWSVD